MTAALGVGYVHRDKTMISAGLARATFHL
jgi:hypothetical protein